MGDAFCSFGQSADQPHGLSQATGAQFRRGARLRYADVDMHRRLAIVVGLILTTTSAVCAGEGAVPSFADDVAPLLSRHCLRCHQDSESKGGLSLESREAAFRGGASGAVIVPRKSAESLLIDMVAVGADGKAEMPREAPALSPSDVDLLKRWIDAGADWPSDVRLEQAAVTNVDWWSLNPLTRPAAPAISDETVANPIDAFVRAKQQELELTPSRPADRRTLIRRLSFDLLGLPPSPEEVDRFVNDPNPQAYANLVERMLASPHYGERWARHWLDVAHYGDTHGYDKDKPRLNAWPYRDYVVRSFNADKPYADFVREQIAGDVQDHGDPEGVVATGFLAAGPWDFISHVEVPEEKIDGQIARSLDRDDMVRTVMETFCSLTVGCARCHHHKFDPITQQDYYNLQAVFAAVDRADRVFDDDPTVHSHRLALMQRERELLGQQSEWQVEFARLGSDELKSLDAALAEARKQLTTEARPEFGYHSAIEQSPDRAKWVQVDLGEPRSISRVVFVGCHDDFNGIGAGFGFPQRYRVDAANDATFQTGVVNLVDRTETDVPNPGVEPQAIDVDAEARYVRVTATKLALRKDDFIFALAELSVLDPDGRNLASGVPVTSLDSIEAPVRWRRSNLVDGYYFGVSNTQARETVAQLEADRAALKMRVLTSRQIQQVADVDRELNVVRSELSALGPGQMVYAAATRFSSQGNFKPTGGTPREIHVLHRGNVLDPREVAHPGAIAALTHVPGRFTLPSEQTEGDRRAALAEWIVHPENPLTWRSIANRIWQYHFGVGLVDTPNDFGRMGGSPTHPELLDWLAVEFRDSGGSVQHLHRLICTSATYQQQSRVEPDSHNAAKDGDNRYLWRMNRRRLEAEAVRDSVLWAAGELDDQMYGPGYRDFVIEKPEHSPHYEYEQHDPSDPATHRRSVYRFIVRSQQQPFLTAWDCADPSMAVAQRNETITPQQALTLLNNRTMLLMAGKFAARVSAEQDSVAGQLSRACRLALGRDASAEELRPLQDHAQRHGLDSACRLIFNLNEFVFVD